MNSIDKINKLMTQVEEKLSHTPQIAVSSPDLRKGNLEQLERLYEKLNISKKHDDFKSIFEYKAMNLSGIGLKAEDFGEIRAGKYIQIISIAYELNDKGKRIAKNSSLGYFGKAEKLDIELKNSIIEFVLRWRYEKAFQHTEYYQKLLERLD